MGEAIESVAGRYELGDVLGSGGFATVYEGLDPMLDARVAIKVLHGSFALDLEARTRFIQEAQLLRRFESRRLVTVYDVGQLDDGRPYFVMKLATLGTLQDRLDNTASQSRTAADLVRLSSELADCLRVLHAENVVHRDVKPSNVFIERDATVAAIANDTNQGTLLADDEYLVLADFGLARDNAASGSMLTVAGGSAGFAAPEQLVLGGQPDGRTDLYSATALLHVALSAKVPIPGAQIEWTLPGTDHAQLQSAFAGGLSPDIRNRPATVDDWLQTFTDATVTNRRAGRSKDKLETKKKRGAGKVVAAAVLVSLIAAGAVGAFTFRDSLFSMLEIAAPASVVAGQQLEVSVEAESGLSYQWASEQGDTGSGATFEFAPILPGEQLITVTSLNAQNEAVEEGTVTVVVSPAANGPEILGPSVIAVGSEASYTLDADGVVSVLWIVQESEVEAAELALTPTETGPVEIGVIVTFDDGSQVGATRTIEIIDS